MIYILVTGQQVMFSVLDYYITLFQRWLGTHQAADYIPHVAKKLLSSGKVPGLDATSAEIYKAGGPKVAEKLT